MRFAIFSLLLTLPLLALADASGTQSTIPLRTLQEGFTIQRTLNTIQNALHIPSVSLQVPAGIGSTSIPALNISRDSILKGDSALQNLNNQIKSDVGIDVPVFIQAILRGLIRFFHWILGLLSQLS